MARRTKPIDRDHGILRRLFLGRKAGSKLENRPDSESMLKEIREKTWSDPDVLATSAAAQLLWFRHFHGQFFYESRLKNVATRGA